MGYLVQSLVPFRQGPFYLTCLFLNIGTIPRFITGKNCIFGMNYGTLPNVVLLVPFRPFQRPTTYLAQSSWDHSGRSKDLPLTQRSPPGTIQAVPKTHHSAYQPRNQERQFGYKGPDFYFPFILRGNSQKRVREMSSQMFVTLYTLSIYPSAHKQLRRHLPNLFREFPCSSISDEQCLYTVISFLLH